MKKRKTGKERAMYAFGGIGEDTRIKPLNTAAIGNANVAPNLLYRSVMPALGIMAPTEGKPGYTEYNNSLMKIYSGYPEAAQLGSDNTFKAYNDGGVHGKDDPTVLQQVLNNIEYMKTNMPDSNIYRLKNSHYSTKDYDTKPKDTPMVAALGTGSGGVSGLVGQIPGIADSIIGMLENNPNAYSSQPIMNASTIKGMKTPYSFALGGEVGDEEEMQELQEMADEQGISVEELIMQLQDAQNPDSMEDGLEGEEIVGDEEPEEEEMDEDEIGETFGGEFAYGGVARKVPIEVEGGEVLENPLGKVKKAVGPSHAKGGVNINVPPGTKIYSDRIKIDGKTMAERKIKREKTEKRIEKLKLKREYDPLVNNSLQRTMQVNQAEEAEDMQLQEVLKGIEDRKKYAGGSGPYGVPTPRLRGLNSALIDNFATTEDLTSSPLNMGLPQVSLFDTPNTIDPTGMQSNTDPVAFQNPAPLASPTAQALPDVETPDGSGFTLGDGLGMAGNLFNAITPFINTRNAAAATTPTINRYRGFGKDAIAANDQAQVLANTMGNEALTDIDTSANSAIERGRNSASSVNTARAMDIATVAGANKAKISARNAKTAQLIGLTGQRGQLTNMKDRMEMSGQERADIENQAKTDNYFSNNAANLVNFGSNIQGLGRNLNTSKQNQTDANLIGSMAKNNIKVNTGSGKIVNKYKTPEEVQNLLDMGFTIDENGKLVRPRKRG